MRLSLAKHLGVSIVRDLPDGAFQDPVLVEPPARPAEVVALPRVAPSCFRLLGRRAKQGAQVPIELVKPVLGEPHGLSERRGEGARDERRRRFEREAIRTGRQLQLGPRTGCAREMIPEGEWQSAESPVF